MIHFKKIAIGYNKTLFTIPDLKLNRGDVFILAGKNGVGKSTLLKTICGYIKPLSGTLLLNNKEINQFNSNEMARTCSIVNSTFNGIPYLKAKDYVALGRTPHTNAWGTIKKEDEKKVFESLKDISMFSHKDFYTNELSDGERQLLSICRAVCQDTPIILFDEPTAFLDYKNKQNIIRYLKSLAKNHNKTILISSHDLDMCIKENIPFLIINQKEKQIKEIHDQNLDAVLKVAFE
mgnify:CR=1 FL=1